ncbi:hypothetical protein B0H14DRAFT_2588589 [Mycena olivaceomarginata]|nr:hypothetical protein B0H14DRAFT_2588589 [Mycena olivaceomarginata]
MYRPPDGPRTRYLRSNATNKVHGPSQAVPNTVYQLQVDLNDVLLQFNALNEVYFSVQTRKNEDYTITWSNTLVNMPSISETETVLNTVSRVRSDAKGQCIRSNATYEVYGIQPRVIGTVPNTVYRVRGEAEGEYIQSDTTGDIHGSRESYQTQFLKCGSVSKADNVNPDLQEEVNLCFRTTRHPDISGQQQFGESNLSAPAPNRGRGGPARSSEYKNEIKEKTYQEVEDKIEISATSRKESGQRWRTVSGGKSGGAAVDGSPAAAGKAGRAEASNKTISAAGQMEYLGRRVVDQGNWRTARRQA